MPTTKPERPAAEIANRSYQLGYLRAIVVAYMVVWMLRSSLDAHPNVGRMIVTMIVGWIVWQFAGRIDDRMDVVAEKIADAVMPHLPSGTRKK